MRYDTYLFDLPHRERPDLSFFTLFFVELLLMSVCYTQYTYISILYLSKKNLKRGYSQNADARH